MNNILVVGSKGSGKTSYLVSLLRTLHAQGEKIYVLEHSKDLRNQLTKNSIPLEEEPSANTILVVDEAGYLDCSSFSYKQLILCVSDRTKYEDLAEYKTLCSEFHLFRFQAENGFKALDLFEDVELASLVLPKFQHIVRFSPKEA